MSAGCSTDLGTLSGAASDEQCPSPQSRGFLRTLAGKARAKPVAARSVGAAQVLPSMNLGARQLIHRKSPKCTSPREAETARGDVCATFAKLARVCQAPARFACAA